MMKTLTKIGLLEPLLCNNEFAASTEQKLVDEAED